MFFIETYNEIEGSHCWPDAPENVAFLRERHRHRFVIKLDIEVSHEDREIEIFMMEQKIDRYLLENYGRGCGRELELGAMSCEALARELAEKFNAIQATVLEDGYWGGGYVRE